MANMLAGVGPVDAALLVVAADEGWMPQSEEHLAVLDLLGVDRAVVAVTKTDRVDRGDSRSPDRRDLREARAAPAWKDPRSWRFLPSTAKDSTDLKAAIDRAVVTDVEAADRPRLWVDRSFTIQGAGTVVTGTLTGGALAVGDEVSVWPGCRRFGSGRCSRARRASTGSVPRPGWRSIWRGSNGRRSSGGR